MNNSFFIYSIRKYTLIDRVNWFLDDFTIRIFVEFNVRQVRPFLGVFPKSKSNSHWLALPAAYTVDTLIMHNQMFRFSDDFYFCTHLDKSVWNFPQYFNFLFQIEFQSQSKKKPTGNYELIFIHKHIPAICLALSHYFPFLCWCYEYTLFFYFVLKR